MEKIAVWGECKGRMSISTKPAGIFAAIILAGGILIATGATQAQKNVVATIAQIGEPLSVIAGNRATVVNLIGEGVDPHLYRLTRSDVLKLNRADMVVYNGLNLEAQMLGVLTRLAPHKPVIGVAETSKVRAMLTSDGTVHDPHVWMDPILWATALQAAVDALARLDPPNAIFYHTNADEYFFQMNVLHARAMKAVASIPPVSGVLVTAHDAFGYFGRKYGLDVLAIQGISTESEAGIRKIETLVDTLVRRRIGAVFIESTVSTHSVKALIEGANARNHQVRIGGMLFSDAMGPRGTYLGTYLGMFDHNITTIVRSLGGEAPKRGFGDQLAETETMQ